MVEDDGARKHWLEKVKKLLYKEGKSRKLNISTLSTVLSAVVSSLCEDESNCSFLPLDQSAAKTNSTMVSDRDLLAMNMIVNYGLHLKVLSSEEGAIESLRDLLTETRNRLQVQQLDNEAQTFDWFVGIVFLVFNGDGKQAWKFLLKFSKLTLSGYLWMGRLKSSKFLPSKMTKSNTHPMYTILCHSVTLIMQIEYPQLFAAFELSNCSPSQICMKWLRQCFLNYLDYEDILIYLTTSAVMGIDYPIYYILAVLIHMQASILSHAQNGDLIFFLLQEPIHDFNVFAYFEMMKGLEKKYRSVVMDNLLKVSKR